MDLALRITGDRQDEERRLDASMIDISQRYHEGSLDMRRVTMTPSRMAHLVETMAQAYRQGQIKRLRFGHCELNKHVGTLEILCNYLKTAQLESLDCSYNWLGSCGTALLVQSLRENTHIQHLQLRHMNMEGAMGGEQVADLLRGNRFLRHLSLEKNRRLGLEGAQELAHGLAKNEHLEVLNLGGCQLGDEAVTKVVQALMDHPRVIEINLSRNRLSLKSLLAVTKLLDNKESTLQSLDLSFNSDLFGEVVFASGEDEESLGVQNNGMVIAQGPPSEMEPRGIVLSFEQQAASRAFSAALRSNQNLRELRLSYCNISQEYAIPMFQALQVNKTLRLLDLVCNRLGTPGYSALFEGMAQMQGLEELGIDYSYPESRLRQLVGALARNKSICKVFTSSTLLVSPHDTNQVNYQYQANVRCCLKKNWAFRQMQRHPENPAACWVPTLVCLIMANNYEEKQYGDYVSRADEATQATAVYQIIQCLLPAPAQHALMRRCPPPSYKQSCPSSND